MAVAVIAKRQMMALKRRLEARYAEISAEISHYPAPIARCDEQLTALIEQRARVAQAMQGINALPDEPRGAIVRQLESLLDTPASTGEIAQASREVGPGEEGSATTGR